MQRFPFYFLALLIIVWVVLVFGKFVTFPLDFVVPSSVPCTLVSGQLRFSSRWLLSLSPQPRHRVAHPPLMLAVDLRVDRDDNKHLFQIKI